jgi:hypothetical protein
MVMNTFYWDEEDMKKLRKICQEKIYVPMSDVLLFAFDHLLATMSIEEIGNHARGYKQRKRMKQTLGKEA